MTYELESPGSRDRSVSTNVVTRDRAESMDVLGGDVYRQSMMSR